MKTFWLILFVALSLGGIYWFVGGQMFPYILAGMIVGGGYVLLLITTFDRRIQDENAACAPRFVERRADALRRVHLPVRTPSERHERCAS